MVPRRSSPGALAAEIAPWDGKGTGPIQSVYDRHRDETGFLATLIGLLDEAELQTGATWLLKRALEDGATLAARDTARFLRAGERLVPWEAILHFLQSLPDLTVGSRRAAAVTRGRSQSGGARWNSITKRTGPTSSRWWSTSGGMSWQPPAATTRPMSSPPSNTKRTEPDRTRNTPQTPVAR